MLKGKSVRGRYSHLCCDVDDKTKIIGEIREDVLKDETKSEDLPYTESKIFPG